VFFGRLPFESAGACRVVDVISLLPEGFAEDLTVFSLDIIPVTTSLLLLFTFGSLARTSLSLLSESLFSLIQ